MHDIVVSPPIRFFGGFRIPAERELTGVGVVCRRDMLRQQQPAIGNPALAVVDGEVGVLARDMLPEGNNKGIIRMILPFSLLLPVY